MFGHLSVNDGADWRFVVVGELWKFLSPPVGCCSLVRLQCQITRIQPLWKRTRLKCVSERGGSTWSWIKKCSRAVAAVCQAAFRAGRTGRKATDAWREREAWCDATSLRKFRAKLFPACSLLACLLPWQRCLSLKCTLDGGRSGDGLHVHLYFDTGRMCACSSPTRFCCFKLTHRVY